MKEVKIEKCPFCGGEEMIECHMTSYGGVYVGARRATFDFLLRSAAIAKTLSVPIAKNLKNYSLKKNAENNINFNLSL